MENLDGSPVLIEAVVNKERGMEKPPELMVSLDGSADVRTGLQQVDLVEQLIGELIACFGMLIPGPLENLFQIG